MIIFKISTGVNVDCGDDSYLTSFKPTEYSALERELTSSFFKTLFHCIIHTSGTLVYTFAILRRKDFFYPVAELTTRNTSIQMDTKK